ncbi:hypothetical protein Y032_0071g542 [Ancylostoma ceylanicum]|uniref:Uncharacterized protein n=1 Tax=Ancylostoma ceylanicum TaxID=53326 RepID=A0A016TY00_9BILA|nr:hypothetical protein Y032_0071g542 [Ancylostoma ceylanicum]
MVNKALHKLEDPAADEGEDNPAAEDNMQVIKTETVPKTPHDWNVLLEDEEAVASLRPLARMKSEESRSWTALEAKPYGYPENIEDIFCSSPDEEACSVTEDDPIIEEDEF